MINILMTLSKAYSSQLPISRAYFLANGGLTNWVVKSQQSSDPAGYPRKGLADRCPKTRCFLFQERLLRLHRRACLTARFAWTEVSDQSGESVGIEIIQ